MLPARWTFFAAILALLLTSGVPREASPARSRLVAPFKVAKLQFSRRGPKLGRWKSTRAVSASPVADVMVVAPWCGACTKTLDFMKMNNRADRNVELILIPRGEVMRARPSQLTQYRDLEVYVAPDHVTRGIRAYPAFFRCPPRGPCRELSEDERLKLLR